MKRKFDKSLEKDKEAKNTVDLMDCLIYNKNRKEIKKKREVLII